MKISQRDLDWAAANGIITAGQAGELWTALESRTPPEDLPGSDKSHGFAPLASAPSANRFTVVNVAYFVGALLVMGAMGFFMTLAWEAMGGVGLFGIATAYAFGFAWFGYKLWRQPGFQVPGGLLVTMAVSMTPLAVYGLERATGFWPDDDPGAYTGFNVWVKGGWLLMELATVMVGLLALKFVRFPFITAPIAFALWYMSMDLTPILFPLADFTFSERRLVSFVFGLLMVTGAFFIDRRTKEDFAFWIYLFGLMALTFGVYEVFRGDANPLRPVFFLTLIVASVLLQRRTFMIFGGFGIFFYLMHLSSVVFSDSILFPFVLTALGLAILFVTVKFQHYKTIIESAIYSRVPAGMWRHLPSARQGGKAIREE